MVKSFFPLGMVISIPFLIFGYMAIFSSTKRVSVLKAFACVFLSLVLIFLLFYQYLQRLAFYFLFKTNVAVYFGSLAFMYLTFTLFFVDDFSKAFGKVKKLNLILCLYTAISALLVLWGLINTKV
jgi:hypothetical protein